MSRQNRRDLANKGENEESAKREFRAMGGARKSFFALFPSRRTRASCSPGFSLCLRKIRKKARLFSRLLDCGIFNIKCLLSSINYLVHANDSFFSCSIIETSMIKGEEKTAQTLQVSIRSKMENADDDTKRYQDSFSGKMRRQGSVKKLDLGRVAELIRDAIVEERPHLRYQLNKSSKDAAREKWTDVHGNSNMFDSAEQYLCVETERLREALDNINSAETKM